MTTIAAGLGLEKPAVLGGTAVRGTSFGRAQRYGEEELAELREALGQNALFYAMGKKVKALEAEACRALGAGFAVGCSSGTASIHAALTGAGISPGDEVITTPVTDMGSVIPILLQGAVPVFADVEAGSGNMSAGAVERCITPRTRAVLAVHLAGNACEVDALMKLCARHDLMLIEDCAQSWGCQYRGRPVGTWGKIGCFSFNEYKHLSCGDGGMVVTNDEGLAQRIRMATDKCYNRVAGAAVRQPIFLANNYRMNELSGAVALAQLRKLPQIAAFFNRYGSELSRRLDGLPGIHVPAVSADCFATYYSYIMRIDPAALGVDAGTFAKALAAEGIPAGARFIGSCVYEYPLFRDHSAYSRGEHPFKSQKYGRGMCPVAEKFLDTCITIQVRYGLTGEDLGDTARAVEKLARWYGAAKS